MLCHLFILRSFYTYISVTVSCWAITMSGMVAASPLLALSGHRGRLATELQAPHPYHWVTVDAWLMETSSPLLAPSSHRGRLVSPCPLYMWLQAPYSYYKVTVDAWLHHVEAHRVSDVLCSALLGRRHQSNDMCSSEPLSAPVRLLLQPHRTPSNAERTWPPGYMACEPLRL